MIVDVEGERRQARPSWRILFVLASILIAFGILLGCAAKRNLEDKPFLEQESNKRYMRSIKTYGERGVIWDSTGRPLAASAPVTSVYANPRHFLAWAEKRAPEEVATAIAALADELGKPHKEVAGHLKKDRAFVYLERRLPLEKAKQVADLRIKGVYAEPEFKRFYPSDYLAAQLVGFTDHENQGSEGIERARDGMLRQANGQRKVLRTSRNEILEEYAVSPPIDGNDIHLTLDLRLQFLAYLGLERTVAHHQAKSASLVLLDAEDGSILAIASYPTYNPNTRKGDPSFRRNRVIQDVFEPGSTMKPIVAAMAVERGEVAPDTVLPTSKPLRYGTDVVRDKKIKEDLTVAEVIMRSSNVGAASLMEMLPSDYVWDMLHNALGFGKPVGIDFPSAAPGILRHYDDWYPIDKASLSYGYGMSVSLLHLARAYLVFANDGYMPSLKLIRGELIGKGRRVFSEQTMRQVMPMLELVVNGPKGTAPKAAVPGYRIAGKTGTAYKNSHGEYQSDDYQSLFVGLAPASKPRFVLAVLVDEPSKNGYYGGTVAAPLFSHLMEHALRLYGVPGDAPEPEAEVALVKQ